MIGKSIDGELLQRLMESINDIQEEIKIMEVCGTHTEVIAKQGIASILCSKIKLLSGPGCPICVTHQSYMDAALSLLQKDVILVTFGDLMRVAGGDGSSLLKQRERGKRIEVIYSPIDAIGIAEENRGIPVVFLAVGFETTAPLIAMVIKHAKSKGLDNLSFLISLKCMEPVLRFILKGGEHGLDGIICPGHVATVKGENYFQFITQDYGVPAVICGFEAMDLIGGIYTMISQYQRKQPGTFKNLYKKWVSPHGNKVANQLLNEVFTVVDAHWRGIGLIENSGLQLKDKYESYDAEKRFNLNIQEGQYNDECRCGEILLGHKTPLECPRFRVTCTPQNPVGPCMVSAEGVCSIYYRYKRGEEFE